MFGKTGKIGKIRVRSKIGKSGGISKIGIESKRVNE